MKLLIAGSRTITDYALYKPFLFKYCYDNNVDGILSGGARGADTIAKMFAEDTSIPFVELLAEWNKLGKSAGFIRNISLVDQCDAAILLWDGESKGTAHTLSLLKASGKPYTIIEVHNKCLSILNE